MPVSALPPEVAERLTAPRAPFAGLTVDVPRIMGIVNVTPDSFSDGGVLADADAAIAHGRSMADGGADILDIGGESTRPGAEEVPGALELDRVLPVLRGLASDATLSIDTRKAAVARAAVAAGAALVNDVSALTYDPEMAAAVAGMQVPVCLMHHQGDPATMQAAPAYDDVLLDVHDWLAARIEAAEAAGIARDRIAVDPGIGFGKTLEHNLALLRGLALFHALGCVVVLGTSRKRFIGTLTDTPVARDRVHGSVASALAGIAQGVQIVRVHDSLATRQALTLWRAATGG